METIANTLQKIKNSGIVASDHSQDDSTKTVVAKFSGTECTVSQRTDTGECYVSVYQDPVASPVQINALLQPLFSTYNIQPDARVAYVSTVVNERMTVQRLTDAISHVFRTFSQSTYGKPTPGDIIQYDRKDATKRLFTSSQAYAMAKGMARIYYDHDLSEVVNHSTQIYNRSHETFFAVVKDNFGRAVRDKNGGCYFVFTDKAERYEKQLLWCLHQPDPDKIPFRGDEKAVK